MPVRWAAHHGEILDEAYRLSWSNNVHTVLSRVVLSLRGLLYPHEKDGS